MWKSNFLCLLLRDLQGTKKPQAQVAVDAALPNLARAA
jgi:hypothetical protein